MGKALAAAVLLGWTFTAQSDVTLTVWTGAGGIVRPDSVVPVLVQIQNDDESRTGLLKAAFQSLGTPPEMWTAERLDLAPGARKRVFLYVPLQVFAASVVVRYETLNGRRIVEYAEPVRLTDSRTPAVAVVGEWPASLSRAEADGQPLYTPLQLRTENLPDRWEGFEMFDALVLTPPPSEPLTTPQVEALDGWILRGGTLVVDVSKRTDAFVQGPLRDLLPLVPAGMHQGLVPEFSAELAYSVGPVRGESLLSSDGRPLVVRRNHGLGSVVTFAFDLSETAFNEWSGRERLWTDVLSSLQPDPPASMEPAIASFATNANPVQDLMNRVSEGRRLPARLGLVLLLTALYALAVGPGDYFLVRRLGNPKLTWITFPAMVAVFTVAAYAGAKAWVGGEMSAKGIQRVLVFADQGRAIRFDLTSLFAPEGTEYDLRHVDRAYFRNLRGTYDPESPLTYIQGDERMLQRIPIWTRRYYIASHEVDAPDIRLSLDEEVPFPVARIENRSDFTLTNCVVQYDRYEIVRLTSLPPGATATAQFTNRLREIDHDTAILPFLLNSPATELPLGRELDTAQALRRGALVFRAATWSAPNPLVVDGDRRPEQDIQMIQVVTYPGAAS